MPHIVPSLWFADNNCQEAINYYTSTFPHSWIESVQLYPNEDLDEHFKGMSGKVITAIFYLNNQKFLALDGGPTFRINEAISFTIECKDQEEIDYYWNKLSHHPEFEQCGWLKDKFGLSWQVVPKDMGALLENEKQMTAMLSMKKIDISILEGLK